MVKPQQTTTIFSSDHHEVRDASYQFVNKPVSNGDVLEAVMCEDTRFHQ